MNKRWIVLLLLFCAIPAIAEESNILKIVESSARTWLGLIDEAKYPESWENTSPLFKAKKTEAEWTKTITAIRSPRGAMNARYIATVGSTKSLTGFPDGDYVVLQFYTTFTEKGLALETITLVKAQDETWQVADYTIK